MWRLAVCVAFPVGMAILPISALGQAKAWPELPLRGGRLTVLIYERGSPVKKGVITAGSKASDRMASLIETKGWRNSIRSYAPVLYIKGARDAFSINISESLIVVNYKANGRLTQKVHPIKKEQFALIMQAVLAELRE